MKVGVIGCGVVGETVAQWLERHQHEVVRYDPPQGHANAQALDDCPAVFICVPTPFDCHQSDMNIVNKSVMLLRGPKTVVIKSTVLPGTTDRLQRENKQHLVFFVPEFLSEDTAANDYATPLISMVGVPGWDKANSFDKRRINVNRLIFDNLIPSMGVVVSAKVAETYKLMRNAYLATKVVFFNEMYDLCEKAGIDFSELRPLATGDPWIRGNHTDALHKGYRGYGGKCFPKDVNALIAYADSFGVDLRLLKEARRVNFVCEMIPLRSPGAIRTSGKNVQV